MAEPAVTRPCLRGNQPATSIVNTIRALFEQRRNLDRPRLVRRHPPHRLCARRGRVPTQNSLKYDGA